MRVIVLKAGKEDSVLEELIASTTKVLEELQIDIKQIQLDELPYYRGHETQEIKRILGYIDQSVGVIIASRVELLSVSGSLCTFFEYCSNHKGSAMFKKPLFALTATDWRGEREAAEHILHVWEILGGLEFGKLGVYTPAYHEERESILGNIERMTEDFYRMIKQGRTPMRSSDYLTFSKQEGESVTAFEHALSQESRKYEGKDLAEADRLKSSEEQDIDDLANFFEKQLNQVADEAEPIPGPQLKSTKHMLSSLPHYFQGQHDREFEAVIQYHMIGEEPFSGYIKIKDGDCLFEEGLYPSAEVELTAEEDVIEEILTKKVTAQKAFMLGRLKVRGNFMLLAKIDQLFKAM